MQDQLALQLSHADQIHKSGILPKWIDSKEKAFAVMTAAKELGVPPMVGCREIFIVNGAVGLTGKLMLGLVFSRYPNAPLSYEDTPDSCTVVCARPGSPLSRFTFSMADARNANLLGKPNWKTWPREMLQWRAVAKMVKALFPECLMGAHFADELGAVTDKDGNIVKVPESESSTATRVTSILLTGKAEAVVEPSPEEPVEADIGEYEVKIGLLKGKKLYQCKMQDLERDVAYWKEVKKRPADADEFIEMAEKYLAAFKDIPF